MASYEGGCWLVLHVIGWFSAVLTMAWEKKYGRVTFALKGVNDGGEFGLSGSFGFAPASKLTGDPDALRMTAKILHSKATGTGVAAGVC
jgi:hypothetical protein